MTNEINATPAAFVLEDDIQIPAGRSRGSVYPFADMKPGQSFAVPSEKSKTVRQAVIKFTKKNPELEFTMRKVSETEHRVWRVK